METAVKLTAGEWVETGRAMAHTGESDPNAYAARAIRAMNATVLAETAATEEAATPARPAHTVHELAEK